MVDISFREIVTDTGLSLDAMIFKHVCPNCKIVFETGMAFVRELGGYFPVCIDGYSMWEIGYCGQYDIDSTTQVYATYAGQHIFCSPTCYKAAKHADTVSRNIANSTRRRKERRDAVRALRPDSICQYCHRPFKAKRIDAKYCSDYCRQNGHRAKKKEPEILVLENQTLFNQMITCNDFRCTVESLGDGEVDVITKLITDLSTCEYGKGLISEFNGVTERSCVAVVHTLDDKTRERGYRSDLGKSLKCQRKKVRKLLSTAIGDCCMIFEDLTNQYYTEIEKRNGYPSSF